jgi:hypothetical protein
MIAPSYPPPNERPYSRDVFLAILRTALTIPDEKSRPSYRFARQAALAWLTVYPGDLPVELIYAQALLKADHPEQALPVLERLCLSDPEFLEVIETLLQARLILHNRGKSSFAEIADTVGTLRALGGRLNLKNKTETKSVTLASWSHQIRQARRALDQQKDGCQKSPDSMEQAEEIVHQALAAEPKKPLVAITHLRILRALTPPNQALISLAEYYHEQWPECLQCSLLLAESLMGGGEPERAVALLHQVAARDVTGQVARRLWGDEHPYRTLWPEKLEARIDMAVPASIAAVLGWNQLPSGEPISISAEISYQSPSALEQPVSKGKSEMASNGSHLGDEVSNNEEISTKPVYVDIPEALRSVQAELERVGARLNRPGITNADGRFPVYVVMTTRQGMKNFYGAENAANLEVEMKRLVEAVRTKKNWNALLFYADEGTFLQGSSITTVTKATRANDAWGLKLALTDLDAALGHRGEMINAVLIVGGPEVVPFHHLPNPVDDVDDDVPSDNPYSTRDENYFIPEWPVGRLPGGASSDAGVLIHMLQTLTSRHADQVRHSPRIPWYKRWLRSFFAFWRGHGAVHHGSRRSFGYTAAIWRRASLTVFQPIGEPREMLVSPPAQATSPDLLNNPGRGVLRWKYGNADNEQSSPLPVAKLAYFNLHGLVDAVEWFGQRDPTNSESESPLEDSIRQVLLHSKLGDETIDYPVALRPQDIVNSGRAPQVVFSEACYGANVLGKTVEEAMALKFLQSGSQAVVGSTCTAYGSISTPLIAADYLGHSFWKYLRMGLPAGEALRRAKIALAKEMHQSQGYLDGEDQKTLISFVLYGDPLAQPLGPGNGAKSILRPIKPPSGIKTVCDRTRGEEVDESLPPEVLAYVKHVVEQYLPGMEGAQLILSHEHSECSQNGHQCPTGQLRRADAKIRGTTNLKESHRSVVILSKQITESTHKDRKHHHYARLTLDNSGKLVKLVVSR